MKYPDYLKHKDDIYEIFELNTDFERYCIFEVRTTDKDGKRYIYAIKQEKTISSRMVRLIQPFMIGSKKKIQIYKKNLKR